MVVTVQPVFPHFVGCGRSGTTLFRNMFNAHPDLAMTHEAHFVGPMAQARRRYERDGSFDAAAFVDDLYRDSNFRRQGLDEARVRRALDSARPEGFADAVRVVFAAYARENGKQLYGDKTPGSVSHIDLIADLFPESKFVHIIRDGRAVALSYLERPEWGPQSMAEAANHWKGRVERGRTSGRRLGPKRYSEARYEDLVADPEPVLRRLCGFLGIDYDPGMLDYHEASQEFIASTKDPGAFENLARPVTAGLRNWREEIEDGDLALFEAIAGGLLAELGYEVDTPSPTLETRIRAGVAALAWQKKRLSAFVGRQQGPRGPEPSTEDSEVA